ncbi:MAG: hypothetical protein M3417_16715 [Actinomycetota bacterium]|nr:hypothetical protein [Actinomycetota bacterium]
MPFPPTPGATMKNLLCLAAVAAVAAPASALAASTPSDANKTNAAKVCKLMKSTAGTTAFTAMIASQNPGTKVTAKNAYGKCVSAAAKKDAAQEKAAKTNANSECKAMTKEQLAAAGFGTKPNAFGKCVSSKAKADKADADEAEVAQARTTANAAKQCKAEKATGRAFGKCVSAKAQAQNDSAQS